MDRTSTLQKLKNIAAKKLGKASTLFLVGAVALTAGMRAGNSEANGGHGEHGGEHQAAPEHAEHEVHAKADVHAEHGEHAKSDAHEEHSGHAEHEAHAKPDAHAAHGEHGASEHTSHEEHAKSDEHGKAHSAHDEHAKADAHAEHGGHAEHDAHAKSDAHGTAHAEHGASEHAEHGKAHHGASEHDAHGEHAKEHAAPAGKGWFNKFFGSYTDAWDSVQGKVDELKRSELENERLRLENAHLRLSLEGLQFNCTAKDASHKTQTIEYKLDKETGSQVGRDLASIAYRVPTNLVPGQLYTLGVSYFKAREDEKAAVIFTFLTGLDDTDAFKTPKNLLMTGIAWYRLDNYATADRYLDRVLKTPESEENLQTLAHARLWKALTAQRLAKHSLSQFWLTELIDHHPLSTEATWVSTKGLRPKPHQQPEAHRGTASSED